MAVLECRQLTKKYGNVTALDRIDLALEPGRIVGLVGPNGSGKTTLIKLAQHLLTPTEGKILVGGMEPGAETKGIVSYLPDRDFLPAWMNVESLLFFYQDFFADFDMERAVQMLQALGIDEKRTFKKLSKGTREKVQLIMTMSRKASVYLLDEPIAGVDPAARDYILRTIIGNYSENSLVLISTHLIADVEPVLDEVVFLKQGRIELHENADALRERTGMSVDGYFREVYRC
ncbi:MAG: ABC transporter ATP-binding protein [Eubacteriales bacterium]|nr:ABC transporter ATP-binding protein [Eubacteriales bacterium]